MKTKRTLFPIVLLLALSFPVKSQDYIKLINDSLYWDVAVAEMGYICDGFSDAPPWRAYFKGDSSIINGQMYYQMGAYGFIDLDGELPACPPFVVDTVPSLEPIAYIREDTENQKVYKYDPWEDKEILLFDFSLNVGDTFHIEGFGDVIVGNVLPYETQDGITRKMIVFEEMLGYMLEGIGGPAGPYLRPIYASVTEGGQWLMCVESKDGNNVFEGPCYDFLTGIDTPINVVNEIAIYPNPFSNYIRIEYNQVIHNIRLLSASGALLKSINLNEKTTSIDTKNLRSGIYFIEIVTSNNQILERKLLKINSL